MLSTDTPSDLDLLARTAARDPDRLSFIFEDERVTFAQLDLAVDHQVERLFELGLEPSSTLALYAGNSLRWVELFFASARAGTVLIPIDYRLGGEEVRQILADASAKWLFYDEATEVCVQDLSEFLAEAGVERLSLGDPPNPTSELGDPARARRTPHRGTGRVTKPPQPEDVFALTFTSGAGSSAKGVRLTYSNLVVGTHQFSSANLGYGRDDMFFNSASLSHRAGWARLAQSVGVGASQVLTRSFNPTDALRLIDEHQVTVVGFVATLFRMMVRAAEASSTRLPSVRTVIATGEPCPEGLRASILELFPNAELTTTYASTEAGIIAALQPAEHATHSGSVGRPISGVDVRILDPDDGSEVAAGETGEIALRSGARGSAGVMLGYQSDNPDDSFLEGWYLSGDLGRLDSEGYLYVTGRKRDMIRSGGLKVSAEEVERCLERHQQVKEAAVVAAPDPMLWEAVVAFVVPQPDWQPDEKELIVFCKQHLASYKKPREVYFVEELPRTPSGKIWKHQLKLRLTNNTD